MRVQRTPEQEQIRQLKILNAQLNPLGLFVRVAFWLFVALTVTGLLARLCLPGHLFPQ